MAENFLARIDKANGILTTQSLHEHLTNVANRCSEITSKFTSRELGLVAGILHDIGKASPEFQERLRCAIEDKPARMADHSTIGAQIAEKKWRGTGKLLAYAIAGHHAGLADGKTNDQSCLVARLAKPVDHTAPNHLIKNYSLPENLPTPKQIASNLQQMMFTQMLFSALVDSDRLDAELFSSPQNAELRQRKFDLGSIRTKADAYIDNLASSKAESTVNTLRASVLNDCRASASLPKGVFTLEVPTGGGKTLSSLSFALNHALHHKMARVIYVIPFISIIEQTARIFAAAVGEENVLEHHSNVDRDDRNDDLSSSSQASLATENWDAPIIVTTAVQFYESLFSNSPSRCRKLHNIINSVIILDEFQTIPTQYILPIIEYLKELVNSYGVTLVLCTATQPALQKSKIIPNGFERLTPLISNRSDLFDKLKRVKIQRSDASSYEELAEEILDNRSALCVVNTRKIAHDLFMLLAHRRTGVYHLSALMYPIHRSAVIEDIKRKLKNKEDCIVVSTQLIEAGVDLDFPVVFRAMAGADSILQAAGRCNREGLLETGKVYVFEIDTSPPGFVRQTADATKSTLAEIRNEIDSLQELEVIKNYYKMLFFNKGIALLDAKNILSDILCKTHYCDLPFKTVSEKVKIIEDNSIPVLITCTKESREIAEQLKGGFFGVNTLRKAQKYCVGVYSNQYAALMKRGIVTLTTSGIAILEDDAAYSQTCGLILDLSRDAESLVI